MNSSPNTHHSSPITHHSFPPAVWRLIVHPPQDGATNMAIDEAIAEHVGAGQSPPTLRFYAWQPACLSLGYAQRVSDVDRQRLCEHGWTMVRRLTGGRAILHVDELTYSVSAPIDEPRVEGGVVESYRRLSMGLLTGLQILGASVNAERAAQGAHGFSGPVCFEVPSDYEITAQGKKLLGSAQTRRSSTVLQHGALPLFGDIARICDALTFADGATRETARERVRSRAITLEEAMGRRLDMPQVAAAITQGFAQALNLTFDEGTLTFREHTRADKLRATKYATAEWNERH